MQFLIKFKDNLMQYLIKFKDSLYRFEIYLICV